MKYLAATLRLRSGPREIQNTTMSTLSQYSFEYLANEAQSLLARLVQIKPFSMTMPMVKGASVSDKALKDIIRLLEKGKEELRNNVYKFIEDIRAAKEKGNNIRQLQARYTILKLRFNSILDQLDIFADVLSQRAEHDVGVWTSGLDVLAEDGISVLKKMTDLPSFVVYLDRGHGAAIRRARTRLPGGDMNPVGVIQIPRERMIGSGIASSLIHEVGHQAASLIDLVPTLKKVLSETQQRRRDTVAWRYYERWISEIIADVWATGHLGVTATLGLMSVVTLPSYFQFRIDLKDPHPPPYVRVLLSCAFGKRLFPHPQWDRLSALWKTFYPVHELKKEIIMVLDSIEKETPAFVDLVIHHSTKEMQGKKLADLFPANERQPAQLRELYQLWKAKKISLYTLPPALVFAVLGQAKSDLVIDAGEENRVLTKVLRYWAFSRN
jgi:hypothetical protein